MCFFNKKQRDTIDLNHGTIELNGFQIDAWTTDELFLKVFGESVTASKKQATYVLRDVRCTLSDMVFGSMLAQFSPLGYHMQRVMDNITLYMQPCKYSDFIRRVASKMPNAKVEVMNDYEFVAHDGNLTVNAHLDADTTMAVLSIEFKDSSARVDNWVNAGSEVMLTPKSGALLLNNNMYHANLREVIFKNDALPVLPAPNDCVLEGDTMMYLFNNLNFFDLQGSVHLGFNNNKLVMMHITPRDSEAMLQWVKLHFGCPTHDDNEWLEFQIRAAGARMWKIRVYKYRPRMEWILQAGM